MANGEQHYDGAFRDTVIAGIAEVKAQNVMILARLDKINGSVGTLFQKTNVLDISLTAHPLTCPTREKLDTLIREVESGDHPGSSHMNDRILALETASNKALVSTAAAAATSKKWLDVLNPILYVVCGGLLLLLIMHAREVIGFYRKGS